MTEVGAPDSRVRDRRRLRTTFLAALAAVLLLEIAWALVTPLWRGPDEVFHGYRASSVALGQWRPDYSVAERGETVATKVEPDIVASADHVCTEVYAEHRPDACEPVRRFDDGTLGVGSSADHYNPVYYALVGAPTLLFEGDASVWAMRAVNALLCGVLLALGFTLLTRGARTRWPATAFLVVTTPAVVFAGAVVAPNGVTFAAAMALWAALISTTRHQASPTLAAAVATLGGTLLVLSHTTGPLWLATIALAHLVFAGWRSCLDVLRRSPRAWTATLLVVGVAAVASLAWTLLTGANDPSAGGEPLVEEVKDIPVWAHVLLWFFQTIGTMPYRFGLLWIVIYLLWLPVLLVLLVHALRKGTPRSRAGLLTALVLSAAIPAALTIATYDQLGVAWQGRYGLPLLFGVMLLGAEGLDRRGGRLPRPVLAGTVGLLTLTHYLALLCLGLRERAGDFAGDRPWDGLLFGAVPLFVLVAYTLLARLGAPTGDRGRQFGPFA